MKKDGRGADLVLCAEIWNDIVEKNSEASDSMRYRQLIILNRSYIKLSAKYVRLKASLMILSSELDWELIQAVRKAGYKIDTANTLRYTQSLLESMRLIEDLSNKSKLASVSIQKIIKEQESSYSNEEMSFESVYASLLFDGVNVDRQLSLAEYNEFRKLIKKRNEQHRKV